MYTAGKRKMPVWQSALALTVLAAGLVFGTAGLLRMRAMAQEGVAKTKSGAEGGVTRAGGQADAGIASVAADPAPGVTKIAAGPNSGVTRIEEPPPPESTMMPDDVRKYLLHIEEVERRRRILAAKDLGIAKAKLAELSLGGSMEQIKGLLGDPNEPDTSEQPSHKVAVDMEAMRQDWLTLTQFMNSVPPPAECSHLHANFDEALGEMGTQIMTLVDILNNAGTDSSGAIGKLEGMKGSSTNIDHAAKSANEDVEAICTKYKEKPWFQIMPDIGGDGGIMKMFGGM